MSEDYTALVAEARAHVADFDVDKLDTGTWSLTVRCLAGAVESLQAELQDVEAIARVNAMNMSDYQAMRAARDVARLQVDHLQGELAGHPDLTGLHDIIERAKAVLHEGRHAQVARRALVILSEADTAPREDES